LKLAAREIESIDDKSLPAEERESRKRRLIRGPKEFRDIRRDRPLATPKNWNTPGKSSDEGCNPTEW
jgi:hypothetical protein